MSQGTYERSLVKVNNSIFSKIKLFFKNLFTSNTKKSISNEGIIEENSSREPIETSPNIQDLNLEKVKEELYESKREEAYLQQIEEEKRKLKFEKIREGFESGELIEEDLCELELQELREYYLQQIEEKKQSIEKYKNKIMKVKTQLDWS